MAIDYIPGPDGEFALWMNNYISTLTNNLSAFEITQEKVNELSQGLAQFEADLLEQSTTDSAARAATKKKNDSRASIESTIRNLSQVFQKNTNISDSLKISLGLNVGSNASPVTGPPSSRPLVSVDTSQRLQHTLSWVDETTPTTRLKPRGVLGAEVWVKVDGESPKSELDCRFLALDTATPYIAVFSGTDAGKTAYYMLRWVNSKGEKGAWSTIISATIVG